MAPSDTHTKDELSKEEAALLEHIEFLEKEAEAKKKAADLAIAQAAKALKDASSDSTTAQKDKTSMGGDLASIAQMIAVAEQEVSSTTLVDEPLESREVESPPTIVRQVTPPASPKSRASASTSSSKPDPESSQVSSPNGMRTCTSILDMEDPIQDTRDHALMMEGTLDYLMDKIDQCTAVIQDPNATVEEHIQAAKLASGYAKAAKAFHDAV